MSGLYRVSTVVRESGPTPPVRISRGPTSQEVTVKGYDRTGVLRLGFCERVVEGGGQK